MMLSTSKCFSIKVCKLTVPNEEMSEELHLYKEKKVGMLNLVKCNLTKLTTVSLAVQWSTSFSVKRFISLAVKGFTSVVHKLSG